MGLWKFYNKVKCFLKFFKNYFAFSFSSSEMFVVWFPQVKQKAAGLMEMSAFLQRRVEDDEKVQQEIEKVFHELIL